VVELSICTRQAIPAGERAKAVSMTTSGMYLGSAGAMYFLPSLAARLGAHSLTRLNGSLGLLWLLLWTLISRRMPARCAAYVERLQRKCGPVVASGLPVSATLSGWYA